MSNLDQTDEILALESILDPKLIHVDTSSSPVAGRVLIHPEVPSSYKIVAKRASSSEEADEEPVEHLPPFDLQFLLPADYPANSAPQFTLACQWLSRAEITRLCLKLDEKWEEFKGSVILFEWIQFLQYESLAFLRIGTQLDLTWFYARQRSLLRMREAKAGSPAVNKFGQLDMRAVQDVPPQADLFVILKEFNQKQKHEMFNDNFHTCKVCFSDKLGKHCMQFPDCGHCYCKECMRDYFEVQIKEGNASSLVCPEEKCTSQALPSQVKELVMPESYVRYDALLLASSLASSNLDYCPRPACQYPVLLEADSTMGSCPNCNFHFCIMCKAGYHGVAPCKFTSAERMRIFELYTNGDASEREELEKRYGKKQVQSLVDDVQTESWMSNNSKACPHCHARIEKMDGCNKMACWRCNTYFCWLCMAILNKHQPYLHYSDSTSKCNGLLFEGLVEDEDRNDWVQIDGEFEELL